MQTKQFHLGDVLSVTTGRLVSPSHVDGLYDILNFMTGDNLFTHQLPRAARECRPYLITQFPQLSGRTMHSAITELDDALNAETAEGEEKKIVTDWLAKQVAKYGEMFTVKPIPTATHKVKDPLTEVEEMMGGPEKVVVVRTE